MSNKTIVSCRNCLDRYPGCHQCCKTYKKERAEYERKKTEENKSKIVFLLPCSYSFAALSFCLCIRLADLCKCRRI